MPPEAGALTSADNRPLYASITCPRLPRSSSKAQGENRSRDQGSHLLTNESCHVSPNCPAFSRNTLYEWIKSLIVYQRSYSCITVLRNSSTPIGWRSRLIMSIIDALAVGGNARSSYCDRTWCPRRRLPLLASLRFESRWEQTQCHVDVSRFVFGAVSVRQVADCSWLGCACLWPFSLAGSPSLKSCNHGQGCLACRAQSRPGPSRITHRNQLRRTLPTRERAHLHGAGADPDRTQGVGPRQCQEGQRVQAHLMMIPGRRLSRTPLKVVALLEFVEVC